MTAVRVRLLAGLAVAGLLAVLAAVAPPVPAASTGAVRPAGTVPATVGRVVLACADPYVDGDTASTVSTGAWPARLPAELSRQLGGSTAAVTATVLPATGSRGRPLTGAQYTARGVPMQAAVPSGANHGLQLVATGALAPGATASVLTRASAGARSGLAEAACSAPGTQFWLTGLSEALGEHAVVALVNVDDGPAQVDVAFFDGKGPISGVDTTGIAVPAHGRTVLDLNKVVPGSRVLAVNVHAVSGRVVVSAHQTGTSGETKLGNDWLPSTTKPARTLVLPGVVAKAAKVSVAVLAPGADAGTATVELLTPTGPIQPAGANQVNLRPGHVTSIDLSAAFAGAVSAVRVRADVPIVGGLREQAVPAKGGTHDTDLAMTGPAQTLAGPVAVAGQPAGTSGSVLLTSTRRATSAAVAVFGRDGKQVGAGTTVQVRADSTVSSLLPASAVGRTVLVTPADPGTLAVTRAVTAMVAGVPELTVLQPVTPLIRADRSTFRRALR